MSSDTKGLPPPPSPLPETKPEHPPEFSLYPLWEASRNREFKTVSGDIVRILSPGVRNKGKGSDFLNCCFVRKGRKTILTGDVEIHVRASDWIAHKHHINPDYRKVILHVFRLLDIDLSKTSYQGLFHIRLLPEDVANDAGFHPPMEGCKGNPDFQNKANRKMLAEAGYQKLQEKGERILRLCQKETKCLLASILRVHGQTRNSETFLQIGVLALDFVLQEGGNMSAEDIFIVLAGTGRLFHELPHKRKFPLLTRPAVRQLLERWEELKTAYDLKELSYAPWEFHSIRPINHPLLRLLQFSVFLKSLNIKEFMHVICSGHLSRKDIRPFFREAVEFSGKTPFPPTLSIAYADKMIDLIVVDGIVPWLLASNEQGRKPSTDELQRMAPYPFASNSKTLFFKASKPEGFKEFTFLEGQGLISLYDKYCAFREMSCPCCPFG